MLRKPNIGQTWASSLMPNTPCKSYPGSLIPHHLCLCSIPPPIHDYIFHCFLFLTPFTGQVFPNHFQWFCLVHNALTWTSGTPSLPCPLPTLLNFDTFDSIPSFSLFFPTFLVTFKVFFSPGYIFGLWLIVTCISTYFFFKGLFAFSAGHSFTFPRTITSVGTHRNTTLPPWFIIEFTQ